MDDALKRFPKLRPALPARIAEIYAEQYKSNREGRTRAASMAQRMESWLHRKVAQDVQGGKRAATLEIGAGTLNQLPYEPVAEVYDIVEPFAELYARSPLLGRVRHIYSDVDQVPLEATYDRITSVAAFEHVCDLPRVVARSGLLLREGGGLRVSIPSEGTILWWLGWRLTTGLEFWLRHGLDYGELMRHEHVNTADEIEKVLRCFFRQVKGSVFGISKALSLYRYYECHDPDRERCTGYLSEGSKRE
jgi:SAM-dependent methyltransferase